MSKYRQHVTRLVNCPKPDFQGLNNRNIQVRSQHSDNTDHHGQHLTLKFSSDAGREDREGV